jgi:hypothetical protein
LVGIVLFTYVAMGAYVAQAAIARAGIANSVIGLWPYVGLWAVLLALVALVIRRAVEAQPNKLRGDAAGAGFWRFGASDAVLIVAFAPLVTLVTFALARALDQFPIAGPLPASWFRRIGWDVSYGMPLAIIALVLIGYAIRDRSSRFAFAAGLLLNVVATIVVLMRFARGSGMLDVVAWITVAQANAIVAGVVALVWLAAIAWVRRNKAELSPNPFLERSGTYQWPLLLVTQAVLTGALCAMFLLPAVVRVIARPQALGWASLADGPWGWSGVALAIAATMGLARGRRMGQMGVGICAAALVALAALTAARWDTGNWLAYHTLLAGAGATAWFLPIVARGIENLAKAGRESAWPILWSMPAARLFGLAAVLLAARAYAVDPASPWWTLAAFLAIAARAIWIAWQEKRPGFMWIAAGLFVPAASIFWLDWADQFSPTRGFGRVAEFLWINVIAAAAMAIVSVVVVRRSNRVRESSRWSAGLTFHRFAAWAIVATLLLTTGAGLISDLGNESFSVSMPLAWAAWLAAAAAARCCGWDPAVRWPVACR